MAAPLTIEVKGMQQLQAKFAHLASGTAPAVDKVLTKGAMLVALNAKKRAPVNNGGLHDSIVSDTGKFLDKKVTANVFYAAFIEFGTGKYAAAYVGTLPAEWKDYAATFKGSGDGGTFDEMVMEIYEWIRRNKIGYTYNEKTLSSGKVIKKRTKVGKQTGKTTDMASAYYISKMILLNGIKPHPFFYPAFNDEVPKIEAEVLAIINSLIK